MISPFFPWFLAFLLLIACVALLVLLLRYRDRSVRLEAESRSWQERAEDRTQMLRRAEEVLKDSFAGISAEVLRNSEKQFLNLAETRLQSQRQQANHDLDSRKQAIESMLKPVSESLKLVQSRLGEMEKERVGAYTDLKTQIRYILSGNEALKNETATVENNFFDTFFDCSLCDNSSKICCCINVIGLLQLCLDLFLKSGCRY